MMHAAMVHASFDVVSRSSPESAIFGPVFLDLLMDATHGGAHGGCVVWWMQRMVVPVVDVWIALFVPVLV
jgi:hypothetical protein